MVLGLGGLRFAWVCLILQICAIGLVLFCGLDFVAFDLCLRAGFVFGVWFLHSGLVGVGFG